jgi:hypothetical protein
LLLVSLLQGLFYFRLLLAFVLPGVAQGAALHSLRSRACQLSLRVKKNENIKN